MTDAGEKKRPSARPGGTKTKRPSEERRSTVHVDNDLLVELRPVATARGVSVPKLVHRLLKTIVNDNLVDAILDDMGDG